VASSEPDPVATGKGADSDEEKTIQGTTRSRHTLQKKTNKVKVREKEKLEKGGEGDLGETSRKKALLGEKNRVEKREGKKESPRSNGNPKGPHRGPNGDTGDLQGGGTGCEKRFKLRGGWGGPLSVKPIPDTGAWEEGN